MSETLSPIGFWSYARQDDEEKLSGLRSILQRQLQQKYGREPIKIFQDVAAIPPGAEWHQKINDALNGSTFLIPIITPNFLESEWCNKEYFLFLEREQAIATQFPELSASRRVFPIFYIDITDVEPFNPQLLPELRKRQWTNFRDLIYKEDTHESVRLRLDQIAESLVKVLRQDQRAVRDRKSGVVASQTLAQQTASLWPAEESSAAQRVAEARHPAQDPPLWQNNKPLPAGTKQEAAEKPPETRPASAKTPIAGSVDLIREHQQAPVKPAHPLEGDRPETLRPSRSFSILIVAAAVLFATWAVSLTDIWSWAHLGYIAFGANVFEMISYLSFACLLLFVFWLGKKPIARKLIPPTAYISASASAAYMVSQFSFLGGFTDQGVLRDFLFDLLLLPVLMIFVCMSFALRWRFGITRAVAFIGAFVPAYEAVMLSRNEWHAIASGYALDTFYQVELILLFASFSVFLWMYAQSGGVIQRMLRSSE